MTADPELFAHTAAAPAGSLRVLHLGNLVNNGYLNAKFQRAAGIEADVVCDESHIISQPEWEEVDLETPDDHNDRARVTAQAATWRQPSWVIQAGDPAARRRFRGEYWLQYRLLLLTNARRARALLADLRRSYAPLRDMLGADLTSADLAWALRVAWYERLLLDRALGPFLRSYDVVQAYTVHPIIPMVVAPDRPWVAYEHGTLRDIPYEPTPRGRLMSLAYRLADAVVITNPDVRTSAERLGLSNFVYIPHPIDETKYRPGESALGARLRSGGATAVLFSPTRHDWHDKGNELVISAFARLVHDGHPHAVIVFTEWGEDVGRSKQLAKRLGIERNVRWLPPLSKPRLLDGYRAADIVLDQFVIGTFGGIVPEAMACAKPVVVAYDAAAHEWCFSEHPPVLGARSEDEIFRHLTRVIHDHGERRRVGSAGREWVERHYSTGVVVKRHSAVYAEIDERRSRRVSPARSGLSL